jgi:hypothetical protein
MVHTPCTCTVAPVDTDSSRARNIAGLSPSVASAVFITHTSCAENRRTAACATTAACVGRVTGGGADPISAGLAGGAGTRARLHESCCGRLPWRPHYAAGDFHLSGWASANTQTHKQRASYSFMHPPHPSLPHRACGRVDATGTSAHVSSQRAEDTCTSYSGRTSKAAGGTYGRAHVPRLAVTDTCCSGHGTMGAHGMLRRVHSRPWVGTCMCCSGRGNTGACATRRRAQTQRALDICMCYNGRWSTTAPSRSSLAPWRQRVGNCTCCNGCGSTGARGMGQL